jgi:copper type II ascorbate-dependent monooxygenase-like protein
MAAIVGPVEAAMHRTLMFVVVGVAFGASACGSDDDAAKPPPGSDPGVIETGVINTADGWVFRTEKFTLAPGEEHFVCYAADAPADLSIQRFAVAGKPMIHHFLMTTADGTREPSGFSECGAAFKFSWRPIFMAGAGKAEVAMPDGAAQQVRAGTQLVLQLHLLNASAETVTEHAEVRMDRSPAADPNPVGQFIFGTFDLALPPKQPSRLQIDCTVNGDVQIFAMFPHMHYLGRKLELELGSNSDSLSPIYTRDPYAFEQQTIDPLELRITPGTAGRLTCSYDNNRDETITYGESTTNEMCFAIGFTVASGPAAGLGGGCFGKSLLLDNR